VVPPPPVPVSGYSSLLSDIAFRLAQIYALAWLN
jgi:hypothetical protein